MRRLYTKLRAFTHYLLLITHYREPEGLGKALIADSTETLVCSWLSLALLVGLSCNYLFGFWQADPIVGLIIVIFLLKEGWETWSEAHEQEE